MDKRRAVITRNVHRTKRIAVRITALLLAVLLLPLTGLNPAAAAKREAPAEDAGLPAGIYTIHSFRDDSKVLAVPGGTNVNGTRIQLAEADGSDAQKFVVTPLGEGVYSITNYVSGRSVDIKGNGKADKTAVQQYRRNQSAAQKFRIKMSGDGYCTIGPSSCSLVFDLPGGRTAPGTGLQIYTFNGSNAQFFRFEEAAASDLRSGTYVIHSAISDSAVLDISGASKNNGGNLQIYRANYSAAQTFTLMRQGDGTYLVSPVHSGKALDVKGGRSANNTNVQQYDANGSKAQRWTVRAQSDGTYTLSPACAPSASLDVHGGNASNKTNVAIYKTNGTKAQRFSFELIDAQRTVPDGCYSVHSALLFSKVLDVSGASVKNGANVQLYGANKSSAQQFLTAYQGNGIYILTNRNSDQALDVKGGRAVNKANVQQYTPNGSNAQKWYLIESGEGTFVIQSALGTVLDVNAGKTANKTNIQTYTANGSAAQRFSFEPEKPAEKKVKKKIVAIDAGHQRHANNGTEPNGPGSSVMKQKVTSGTYGNWSGLNEYELNLQVSLKLKAELEARGYEVYMIRTTHDVDISNVQRAQMATAAGADIFIRVHANSSDNSSVRGAMAYQPSGGNPYLSSAVISGSQRLTSCILNGECAATGLPNKGILTGDDMTGINWATMPVTIIEMGFMSNPTDDLYMASASGQAAIVQGIANGVDQYFG